MLVITVGRQIDSSRIVENQSSCEVVLTLTCDKEQVQGILCYCKCSSILALSAHALLCLGLELPFIIKPCEGLRQSL